MSEVLTQQAAAAGGLSRRSLLKATAAGGIMMLTVPFAVAKDKRSGAAPKELNAFIKIGSGDAVTLVMPRVEMGQGAYTGLAVLIAEELEVDPSHVKLEHAPPNDSLYKNPMLGGQVTGGSTSVAASWKPLREAGATARTMLIQAAAASWNVPVAECHAERAQVIHGASGRGLAYSALAERAAALPVPKGVHLKDTKDFKLIGGNQRRVDAPEKVNGSAKFGIDTQLPGMLIVAAAASPYFGGKVKSLNEKAARDVRGVKQVLNLGVLVAVLAEHNGAARKGLAAAAVEWDHGPAAAYSTDTMLADIAEASKRDGGTARKEGDVAAAREGAARTLEAIYQQPFLAHAAMEPMTCTVLLKPGHCEVWTGTQVPVAAQSAAATAAGLNPEQVTVHNLLLGGGFGRRLDIDNVTQAVRIAKHAKVPVKVVWSRDEDIQHDVYRPFHYNRVSASLDKDGFPTGWQHRVTGSSVMARFAPAAYKNDVDVDAIRDAAGPYAFPNVLVQYVRHEPPAGMLTGWWRGVGHAQNAFPVECFLDELASAAGKDPLEYRVRLLEKHPRAVHVLRMLAERANWSKPMPEGQGKGLALTHSFGTYAAQVVEVAVDADGTVRPLRMVTVVDCGTVVTPGTVEAQVQGGNVFGLTAVLFGNITIQNGRIAQSNFHDYRLLRMSEMPVMETHIVQSTETPTGIGEVSTVLVSPALVNAVHAATGKRVRTLPIDPEQLRHA